MPLKVSGNSEMIVCQSIIPATFVKLAIPPPIIKTFPFSCGSRSVMIHILQWYFVSSSPRWSWHTRKSALRWDLQNTLHSWQALYQIPGIHQNHLVSSNQVRDCICVDHRSTTTSHHGPYSSFWIQDGQLERSSCFLVQRSNVVLFRSLQPSKRCGKVNISPLLGMLVGSSLKKK